MGRPPTSKEHINNHKIASFHSLNAFFLSSCVYSWTYLLNPNWDDQYLISNGPQYCVAKLFVVSKQAEMATVVARLKKDEWLLIFGTYTQGSAGEGAADGFNSSRYGILTFTPK